MIRLDKFLSDAGAGTRSEVKALIRQSRVTVNGQPVQKPETKIDPAKDEISADGHVLSLPGLRYYLLHKPAGYVCAVKDNLFPTVMELLPHDDSLFPVGRLDKDTEGLLLITNDGTLTHNLLSPRRHVDKTYLAVLDRPVAPEDIPALESGLDIGDETLTLPAKLNILSDNRALLTIREGRFHQVKRMFHAVGCEVLYLKRLSLGPLVLPDDLEKGSWRELTQNEISALEEAAGAK